MFYEKTVLIPRTPIHSFTKNENEDDPPFTKLVFDVFKRERGKEVIDVLTRLSEGANELGYKGKHGEKGNSIGDAIGAKATSDYFSPREGAE